MRYLITDWDELHEALSDVPHQWRATCPLPVAGDAWVVEAPFAEPETLAEAVRSGVSVLLVGSPGQVDPAIRTIQGLEWQVGEELDPEAILAWMRTHGETKAPRPAIRKHAEAATGVVAVFAGLLPTGGGVGKDTLTLNTAAWLAKRKIDVAVADLDPFGTLGSKLRAASFETVDIFAEERPEPDIETIRRMFAPVKLGFGLLPSSGQGTVLPGDGVQRLIHAARRAFSVTILNLGSGQTNAYYAALEAATHVYLVGQGDRGKFRAYKRALEELTPLCRQAPRVILNRFYDKDAPSLWEEEFAGSPPFAAIFEDRRVFEATEAGEAAALKDPKRPFGRAIEKIAADILGEEPAADAPRKEAKRKWLW